MNEEIKEHIDCIEKALQFYANGDNYEWDGCHCHGRYIRTDHGEEAEKALQSLIEIKEKL